jgi:hypothetical protein
MRAVSGDGIGASEDLEIQTRRLNLRAVASVTGLSDKRLNGRLETGLIGVIRRRCRRR